ncbi:glycosyltransferase [Candidatus Sumerlaeota bacterium]|nr:glycosyltransferase [Candidatus Sumerlaeota bacterium]
MKKIKIIYFIGSLRLGGAEKQVVELALGLDRSRYDMEICCINQGGPMVEAVRASGIPVNIFEVSLPYGKFNPRSWFHLLKNLRRIHRYIRESKPDIIHGYLFTAYIVGVFCGVWAKVPILISSRRSLGYFKEDKFWRQAIENLANRKTDAILVNSNAVWNDVIKREKHCDGKIHLIYNGVDLDKFKPQQPNPEIRTKWRLRQNDILVGVVANLIHYKGHMEILDAAALLKKDFPDLRFVFIGRDGGMQSRIEKNRSILSLDNQVILAGSREDVEKIIPAFDILLLASHEEGFSNVLLEGMACGKPIVATDVGGNAESVKNGETGFIVPPKNPQKMAEALKKLIADPSLREKFGRAGRTRVEQKFSLNSLIQYMDAFYQEIAKEKLNISD